jgi:hypothetical protein
MGKTSYALNFTLIQLKCEVYLVACPGIARQSPPMSQVRAAPLILLVGESKLSRDGRRKTKDERRRMKDER